MRIGKARHDGLTAEIDNLLCVKFLCVGVRSDEGDAPILHRDRLGVRIFFVNGVNISILEEKIRLRFIRA